MAAGESAVKRRRLAALQAAAAAGRVGQGGGFTAGLGGGSDGGGGGGGGGGGAKGDGAGEVGRKRRGQEAGGSSGGGGRAGGGQLGAPRRPVSGGRGEAPRRPEDEGSEALYAVIDSSRLSVSAREGLGSAHPQGPAAGVEVLLQDLMETTSKGFDRQLAVDTKVHRKILMLEKPRKSVSIYKAGAQARKAGARGGALGSTALRKKGLRDPCWVGNCPDGQGEGSAGESGRLHLSQGQTLNALWEEYVSKELVRSGTMEKKLSGLSWLGSSIRVTSSPVSARVGIEGIVVQETARTFVLLVADAAGGVAAEPQGRLLRVLKEGATFACKLPGRGKVTLHGDGLCN